MRPPLRRLKPFLKLSRKQQKRRIRALVQADLAYLANATNNAASSPTRPPSCSPPTARASNIPDDVCHQIDDFFDNLERFDDADLNLLINERPTLTNTDIQMENQAQSTITRPTSITNLQDFLAHWAIQNKIPQSVVNDLLRGLKKFGHPELPSDARTLCDTPNRTDIQALAGGTYVHYGLERALKEQLRYRNYNVLLQRNDDTEISVILQININIDGLPLSKSSKSQLWPILDDCRKDRKRFENFILQKVNELLEVVRRNDNPVERTDCHYALLPQMPFNDINELQRFDRDLKDNGQMRDQFMKKIQDIGGKSVQKAVKYAMEVVMTDDLTQQVVWTFGAENKPKISKFTFPYVIIDAVRNTFEGTKMKAVEDRIAEWLRRGGDRKKAENKRRERQNLQQ